MHYLFTAVIRTYFLALFWVISLVIPAYGQYQIDLDILTVDDGLSQNVVTSLLTDSRGFLWIGTNDGLNRYDGLENRIFQWSFSDANTLLSSNIVTLAESHSGEILVGHFSGGVSVLHPITGNIRRYRSITTTDGVRDMGEVFDIEPMSGDRFYAISTDGVLYYNPDDEVITRVDIPSTLPALRAVYAEADSSLLLFSHNRAIHRFHLRHNTLTQLVEGGKDDFFPSFSFQRKNASVYAMNANETAFIFDAQRNEFVRQATFAGPLLALHYDGKRLWGATNNGSVQYWDLSEADVTPVLVTPTVSQGRTRLIRNISSSLDGVVWLGSLGNGLSKAYQIEDWFGLLSASPGTYNRINNASIRAIFPLDEDRILIGGYDGLERYDFRDMSSEWLIGGDSLKPLFIPYRIISDPRRDSDLWIGSEGAGLLRYDLQTDIVQRYLFRDGDYPFNVITDMLWLTADQLALATNAGLLFFDLTTREEVVIPGFEFLAERQISLLLPVEENRFYIGTVDGYFAQATRELAGWSVVPVFTPEMGVMRLISATRDSSGGLWLGTDNGILHLDAQHNLQKTYTMESGLPNSTIYSVQFDTQGNLWSSTNYGISRMDVQRRTFTNFSNRDGLQSNEFNNKSFANWNSDIFFLGGIGGVNYFRPLQISSDVRSHTVYVEAVQSASGTQRVTGGDRVDVSYLDGEIRVRYATPIFYNSRSSDSWYRFANLDTTWRRNPLQNELIIAGIQPGSYHVQLVRASVNNLHLAPITEIWIRVRPPLIQVWYVQLILFLLLVGLITFSVNSYLQKLRVSIALSRKYARQLMTFQDQERRRVAEALHDSIGSKLTLIKLSFRQVLMTVKDDFAAKKYVEINELIGETISEIREISQNLHPHLLENIGISKSLVSFFESLQEVAHIRFRWEIDPFDDYLKSDEVLIYYRFLQECVTNVLKHSRASECEVRIKIDLANGILVSEIRDNGVGLGDLRLDQPAKTMGFRSFEERATQLGATFSYESTPGKGTLIRLIKPI